MDGEWHFLGACEPEEVLDTGWFSGPANRAILIHTRNFSDYVKESNEEYLGKEGALYYFNHTDFYGRTKLVKILVKDEKGKPAAGAHVVVEILNMAEFFPAAVMIADADGEVQMTLGLGDIRVRAFDGIRRAEAMMRIEEEDSLELVLQEEAVPSADDTWQTLEIRHRRRCRYGMSLPQRSRRSAMRHGWQRRNGFGRHGLQHALMRKKLLRIRKRKRFSTGQERILRRFIHSFPKMKIRTGRSCCFRWN